MLISLLKNNNNEINLYLASNLISEYVINLFLMVKYIIEMVLKAVDVSSFGIYDIPLIAIIHVEIFPHSLAFTQLNRLRQIQ